jgi:hypothetical protein
MKRCRNLPIEWHFFGPVDPFDYRRRLGKLKLGGRLHLYGPYDRDKVCELLAERRVDVTLLLPIWDETFCYTLSESWLAGVPVIVSNVGALPERTRESGAGIVVESTDEAFEILSRWARDRAELTALREKAAAYRHRTLEENANHHRSVYDRLWKIVTTSRDPTDLTDAERELSSVYYQGLIMYAGEPPESRPAYHSSWWYPHYVRIKPLVPPSWRGLARRVYRRTRRPVNQ